jgi:hypothetical protein
MEYDKVAPIGPPEEQIMRWIAKREFNHRGVLAPRGIGKTHIVIAYAAFCLNREPELKILIVSKTELHAKDSLKLLRGWLTKVAFLKRLRPNRSLGHRDQVLFFDVGASVPRHRTPSVSAAGIDGQLEGRRAGLCIADDVETERNSLTVMTRQTLDTRIKELSRVTSYLPREIVVIGTYHSDDSVYRKLATRGYVIRTWPVFYPTEMERFDDQGDDKILNLSPELDQDMIEGRAKPGNKVFPHRHDDKFIEDAKSEGDASWEMHYMLMVTAGDRRRYPLRLGDLICEDAIEKRFAPSKIGWGMNDSRQNSTAIDDLHCVGFGDDCFRSPAFIGQREMLPYQQVFMYIDPSGRGTDLTGFCVIGFLNGKLFVLELDGMQGGYDEDVLERICRIAKANGVQKIMIEDEFGSGMMVPLLQSRIVRHFARGVPTLPSGELSGPHAVSEQRRHVTDRWQGSWGCIIEGTTVARGTIKEARILDVLEPVVQHHRLVIDRRIAANTKFQQQFTRLQRLKGCLPNDDIVDALAGCVKMFSDRMDVDPSVLERATAGDLIERELENFRVLQSNGVSSSGDGWVPHR